MQSTFCIIDGLLFDVLLSKFCTHPKLDSKHKNIMKNIKKLLKTIKVKVKIRIKRKKKDLIENKIHI